jgi:transposase
MGTQIHAKTFVALLIRFPTQCELQRASPKQLARWLPKRRRAVEDGDGLPADELIKRIRAAQPLVTDQAVLLVARMEIVRLAQLIGQFHETIDAYERELAKVLAEHPDAELFAPAPGAGPALTPRLVAAFGSDRQRYQSAEDLQRLSGIAPITVQSGKSRAVRMRRACSKFLRQTFHEFAACSRKASVWARAYYDMLRAKGHRHQSAIRALAYKWLRILFRCWQTRTPYDEARYLKQLRLKNSPLLAYLPTTTIPVST